MTKTLTPAQRALLTVAAQSPNGVATTPKTRATIAALIKAGLLLLPPGEDAPDRLVPTPLGRALVDAGFKEPEPSGGNHDAAERPAATVAVETAAKTTKTDLLRGLLERPDGATIVEMSEATGWLTHSVRGFMAGTLKTKFGLSVEAAKEERGRVYRIAAQERDGANGVAQ